MIRSSGVGIDFYKGVIERIAERDRGPRGIVLHFAGSTASETFVLSVYSGRTAMTRMFTDFTGPEIANQLHRVGVTDDITRHEFPVERLFMDKALTARAFEHTEPGEYFGFAFFDGAITKTNYEIMEKSAKFPAAWPDGLLVHLVANFGDRWGVFDLWDSTEQAQAHYLGAVVPAAAKAGGFESTTPGLGKNWIDIHTLYVPAVEDDPVRHFARE
jgi:hypothetical protein